MVDWLIKYWLNVLFTGVLTLLTGLFGWYSKKYKTQEQEHKDKFLKQEKEQEALKGGMKALLRDRIIETYNQCSAKKSCPIYALENVESLYVQYSALGGNGTATQLIEELRDMPRNKNEK